MSNLTNTGRSIIVGSHYELAGGVHLFIEHFHLRPPFQRVLTKEPDVSFWISLDRRLLSLVRGGKHLRRLIEAPATVIFKTPLTPEFLSLATPLRV